MTYKQDRRYSELNDNVERAAMNRHARMRSPMAARRLARPQCPHCNDMLIAPAVSVHVHHDDIRHWWTCDACGHEFMTAVTVANMRAEQYRARVA
jgi:transcription elongation factor Elf1